MEMNRHIQRRFAESGRRGYFSPAPHTTRPGVRTGRFTEDRQTETQRSLKEIKPC